MTAKHWGLSLAILLFAGNVWAFMPCATSSNYRHYQYWRSDRYSGSAGYGYYAHGSWDWLGDDSYEINSLRETSGITVLPDGSLTVQVTGVTPTG